MQPHELLRAAAKVIENYDWCQAEKEHARDPQGNEVKLYAVGAEGTSVARINPNAASTLVTLGVPSSAATRASIAASALEATLLPFAAVAAGSPSSSRRRAQSRR